MKRILSIVLVLMFVFCAAVAADPITLKWDPPVNANQLPADIQLYYQLFHKMEQNSAFDFSTPVYDGTDTQFVDTQTQLGNHRYAVWAYYVWYDGIKHTTDLSNTVNYEIKPPAPELDAPTLMIEGIDQIQGGLDKIRQALAAMQK